MDRRILAALFVLPLAACVVKTNEETNTTTTEPAPLITYIATPFYLPLKVATCAATVPIAGIVGGVAQLATPDSTFNRYDLKEHLGEGVIENCGPPYLVTP